MAFGPKPIDTNVLAVDPSIDCPEAFLFGSQFRKYCRAFEETEKEKAESRDFASAPTRLFSFWREFFFPAFSGDFCVYLCSILTFKTQK